MTSALAIHEQHKRSKDLLAVRVLFAHVIPKRRRPAVGRDGIVHPTRHWLR